MSKVKDIQRFKQVLKVLTKYGLHWLHKEKGTKRKIPPKEFAKLLDELGGAFPKLGQLLSLRPDLIPADYCEALSTLQDKMKPFANAEAIVNKELGRKFTAFNKKPIAAASIGQVHEGKIGKQKVAIKIQRPKIKELIETDIEILEYFAKKVKNHIPSEIADPEQIAKEFKDYTEQELNYTIEAHAIKGFRTNYAKRKVIIPELIEEYSNKKILTMSYVQGKKVTQLKNKKERKQAATDLVHLMLQGIFIDGYFHGDPHPGNVFINKGTLVLLDYGIVGRISERMKEELGQIFVALLTKDVDAVAESLKQLGFTQGKVNDEQLRNDLSNNLGKYYDVSLKNIEFGELLKEGMEAAKRNNIALPKNYVLLMKAIVTTEGTGRTLNPEFNFVREAHPFMQELISSKLEAGNILKKLTKNFKHWNKLAETFPKHADDLFRTAEQAQETMTKIDKDLSYLTSEISIVSGRLIAGLLAGAFVIAGALTINTGEQIILGLSVVSISLFILAGIMLAAVAVSIAREK